MLTLDLLGGAEIISTARHWARATMLAWHGQEGHAESDTLLTKELISNAVLHSSRPVRLRATPGAVYVEVFDQGPREPRGKVVWAEVRVEVPSGGTDWSLPRMRAAD